MMFHVVVANDALMTSCSKPAVHVALGGPGLWLEWGGARGLSVWLSRTANEKDSLLCHFDIWEHDELEIRYCILNKPTPVVGQVS